MTTFRKIKKGLLIDACLKSLLWGVSAAGGAIGALLLLNKLLEVSVQTYIYIAFGACGFVIAAAIAFALTYKSDRGLAHKLDRQFDLGQRAITMVEFEGENSPMVLLQREQTEDMLAALPCKKPFLIRYLASLIALLLAAGLLVSGVIIPKKQSGKPTDTDIPFSISEWQMGALGALIDEVKYSEVEQSVKDELVGELERLRDVLGSTTTKSKMINEVVASIVAADLIVENASSYKAVCVALDSGESLQLKQMAAAMITLNGIGFGDKLGLIREELSGEDASELLLLMSTEAQTLLSESEVEQTDELLLAVRRFAESLGAIAESTETSDEIIASLIDKEFSDAADAIGTQLSAQYRKRILRDRVISKLIEIFDIPKSAIPELLGDIMPRLSQAAEDEEDDGDGENENGGGFGDGNNLFGSDDIIFHPTGENGGGYVKYGDVYDEYYKIIEELLLYGDLDEDTQKILIEYFTRLSDGSAS